MYNYAYQKISHPLFTNKRKYTMMEKAHQILMQQKIRI